MMAMTPIIKDTCKNHMRSHTRIHVFSLITEILHSKTLS